MRKLSVVFSAAVIVFFFPAFLHASGTIVEEGNRSHPSIPSLLLRYKRPAPREPEGYTDAEALSFSVLSRPGTV